MAVILDRPQHDKIFLAILLTTTFSTCVNHDNKPHLDKLSYNNQENNMDIDMDFLDTNKLTIGKTFLYGNYEKFIIDMGIPSKVKIIKTDFVINSKVDLDKVVANVKTQIL